ncbi:MAG: hypothetical protein BA864_12830 [Desulfuromonadales bacterium C00003093]|nr:MAG: hypothetical protein BA864_12830 [Desulfuromonadales bacterium C00003093]
MKHIDNKGFSLVEILVVLVIMGLVTTAILSLFQSTQKHAYTQDNVVDLQQNLRIAMDRITKDVQMAGFLIPATTTPVVAAPNFLCRDSNADGDCADTDEAATFTLQSASPSTIVAWPTAGVNIPADTSGASPDLEAVFTVATSEMVDLFESGASGDEVRIIRTPDHVERIVREFVVSSKDRTAKTLTLKGFVTGDIADYLAGDLIVRHTGGAHPESISYTLLIDGQLQRDDGNGTETLADNITDVELNYILDGGAETTSVAGTVLDPFDKIMGIRVTLTGTSFDLNSKGDKTRQLTKLIALRNR